MPPLIPDTSEVPAGSFVAFDASAGTGKTHAIAGIAVRALLLDEVHPAEVAVVTFTKAAAAQLRSRIRSRLSFVRSALLVGSGASLDDPWTQALFANSQSIEHALRIANRALEEIDMAEISTIDSFASQMLRASQSVGGIDARPPSATDGSVLRERAVRTELLRSAETLPPSEASQAALKINSIQNAVKEVVNNADAQSDLLSATAAPSSTDPVIATTALTRASVVRNAARRYRSFIANQGVATYSAVTEALMELVGDGSTPTAALLRQRFRLVMVDEFQDTNPQQWAIFKGAFLGSDDLRVVIVGDPKQAIYGFRGGDVATFEEASALADEVRELTTNWRSDGPLVAATQAMLRGGDLPIPEVDVPPEHETPRLRRNDGSPILPLQIRACAAYAKVGETRTAIFSDLADLAIDLFDNTELSLDDDKTWRAVEPRDVAVLVRTRSQIVDVLNILRKAGIPAVNFRSGDLLDGQNHAVQQWKIALELASRPSDHRRIRRYGVSWFVGADPEEIDSIDDDALIALAQPILEALQVGETAGPAEVMRTILRRTGVLAHVLGQRNGERNAVDLEHAIDAIAGLAPKSRDPAHLLDALKKAELATNESDVAEERQQRSESEGRAVTVTTLHNAKGLEWPVVLLPALSDLPRTNKDDLPLVYRASGKSQRLIDPAWDIPWWDADQQQTRNEQKTEMVLRETDRQTYVALTRAECLQVVWWYQPHQTPGKSPLTRLLFESPYPTKKDYQNSLVQLSETVRGWGVSAIAHVFEPLDAPARRFERPVPEKLPDIRPAEFSGFIDRRWRQWSFSSLHSSYALVSDPLDPTGGDSSARDEERPIWDEEPSGELLFSLAKGTDFGNAIHAIFEQLVGRADIDERVHEESRKALRFFNQASDDASVNRIAHDVLSVLSLPLGVSFDQIHLGGLDALHSRCELDFDLPLRSYGRPLSLADLGRIITRHLKEGPAGLAEWAQRLQRDGFVGDILGNLTGSIDLVLQHGDDSQPRFSVLDYKTNWLGASINDYQSENLLEAMKRSDYLLQGLLYLVAVHRLLRWRLTNYEPGRHLGGMGYLFVRGMVPTNEDPPSGIFSWTPPAALIEELSNALAES